LGIGTAPGEFDVFPLYNMSSNMQLVASASVAVAGVDAPDFAAFGDPQTFKHSTMLYVTVQATNSEALSAAKSSFPLQWDLTPPLASDFKLEVSFSDALIATGAHYCTEGSAGSFCTHENDALGDIATPPPAPSPGTQHSILEFSQCQSHQMQALADGSVSKIGSVMYTNTTMVVARVSLSEPEMNTTYAWVRWGIQHLGSLVAPANQPLHPLWRSPNASDYIIALDASRLEESGDANHDPYDTACTHSAFTVSQCVAKDGLKATVEGGELEDIGYQAVLSEKLEMPLAIERSSAKLQHGSVYSVLVNTYNNIGLEGVFSSAHISNGEVRLLVDTSAPTYGGVQIAAKPRSIPLQQWLTTTEQILPSWALGVNGPWALVDPESCVDVREFWWRLVREEAFNPNCDPAIGCRYTDSTNETVCDETLGSHGDHDYRTCILSDEKAHQYSVFEWANVSELTKGLYGSSGRAWQLPYNPDHPNGPHSDEFVRAEGTGISHLKGWWKATESGTQATCFLCGWGSDDWLPKFGCIGDYCMKKRVEQPCCNLQLGSAYRIQVKARNGAGSWGVATSRKFQFDSTPPHCSAVLDIDPKGIRQGDIDGIVDPLALWGSVHCHDPDSGIKEFKAYIGTYPGGEDVYGPDNLEHFTLEQAEIKCHQNCPELTNTFHNTSSSQTPLRNKYNHSQLLMFNLVPGVQPQAIFKDGYRYFFKVVAVNNAGLIQTVFSDGVVVDKTPPSCATQMLEDGTLFAFPPYYKWSNRSDVFKARWAIKSEGEAFMERETAMKKYDDLFIIELVPQDLVDIVNIVSGATLELTELQKAVNMESIQQLADSSESASDGSGGNTLVPSSAPTSLPTMQQKLADREAYYSKNLLSLDDAGTRLLVYQAPENQLSTEKLIGNLTGQYGKAISLAANAIADMESYTMNFKVQIHEIKGNAAEVTLMVPEQDNTECMAMKFPIEGNGVRLFGTATSNPLCSWVDMGTQGSLNFALGSQYLPEANNGNLTKALQHGHTYWALVMATNGVFLTAGKISELAAQMCHTRGVSIDLTPPVHKQVNGYGEHLVSNGNELLKWEEDGSTWHKGKRTNVCFKSPGDNMLSGGHWVSGLQVQ
jgi:hypothetical protein